MFKGKKAATILLVLVFLTVTACATHHYEGAGAGGAIGGIAGALLDKKNHWRGGVIGAGLGALAGAAIADIAVRGSREAANAGKPVEYRTTDGQGLYRAEPAGDFYRGTENTKCRKVRETIWENDKIVKDTVKEICEGEKTEPRY